ncbi:MAG TPA: PAS domain S-box protein [Deltaproteobacteria bacterium]|nr:PAS domain S-box protein [Deltaproteobacteria bacterium]
MEHQETDRDLKRKIEKLEEELLRARESARESEERYRALFDRSFYGVFIMDLEGRILDVNDIGLKMLGYRREHLGDLNFWNLISEDQAAAAAKAREELLRTGLQESTAEYRFKCRDGGHIWVEATSTVIYRGGHPYAVQGIARDITERKRAEDELKSSEERFRSLIQNASDIIVILSGDGLFSYESPSVERILQYPAGYLIGKSPQEFIHPDDVPTVQRKLDDVYRIRNDGQPTEFRMKRFDGSWIHLEAIGKNLIDFPGINGLVITARDITERKKAEEALRQSEERYRSILDNMQEAYYEVDLKGNFTFFNTAAMERLGYTDEEMQGMNFHRIVDRQNARRVFETYHRVFTTGKPVTGFDWEVINKSGGRLPVAASVSLKYDAQGKPVGFSGVVRDITERKKAEEALRQSEERYRSILDNMQEAYYEVDLKGNFTFFNLPTMASLGYTVEEMQGMNYRRFADEENAQKLFEVYHRVFATGKSVTGFEWDATNKNGEKIPAEASVSLKYDAAGNPVGFKGIVRDISERRKAQDALRRSEEKYRNILESIHEAYIELDLAGNLVFFNDPCCKMLGYDRHELMGMSYRVFISPEAHQRMYEAFRNIYETGAPAFLMDYDVLRKDGSKRTHEMSASLIRDASGKPVGFRAVGRDITERKRAEENLRQSEERFREMARLMPDTIYETDEKGVLTFVNEAAFDKFRYSRDDFSGGLNCIDMLAPEDRDRGMKNFVKVLSGEHVGLTEYIARRKDGGTFPILMHSTVIIRNGTPAGVRGFIIDISDKKILEEQLIRAQKMEAIGTLAGGIAHDFNNLLMGVLGNVSLMLLNMDSSHPFYDRLKNVEEYVHQGSELTKQFLGFARGGKYEVKPTHLGDFVHRSSEMFGRTKKEIRIHRKVQEGLWAVEVDRNQMEQVMLNLFVNAWQAMPGGGDLYLSTENIELRDSDATPLGVEPGRFVRVSVTDTGVGMDDSVRARIFEPFFTTKGKGRGTGLGLASVYGIVKNHRGFVTVESRKGAGSTFTIYLPASDKPAQEELRISTEAPKGRETILLIDDEKMVLEVGSEMLKRLGYEVLTASGGRAGIETYRSNRDCIHLVVLDMIMPDLGGSKTFDGLLDIDPNVKVLLSSGYSLVGQAREIMEKGCRGFIQKPFGIHDLAEKIRKILDGG